jgi:5,10-methylenetetrahydromethanopterin reductase
MKEFQISIAFQTNKSADDYISLAKLVNRYEFDAISVYCDAPYHPSFGPLFLMAPHIQRARLGPAAVSPFRMHPIDIAANTALLANLALGGVYLGLARGAWLDDFGIKEPLTPILGIKEAIIIIRKLLSGELAGFNGKVFNIAEHVTAPYPLPRGIIPVLIGTWGSRTASLVGEIADEVKVGGSTNPEMGQRIAGCVRQGELKVGRNSGSVGIVLGAVTVIDEDRTLAQSLAKEALSLYLPVVAKLDPTVSLDPELIEKILRYVEQGDAQSAGKLIPDEILNKFAFSGDEKDIINQVENLFETGVTRVEFGSPHGLTSVCGIKLLGEKVLPYFAN